MRNWIVAVAFACTPLVAGTITDPEAYTANSNLQLDWARSLFQRIDLAGHERILDVCSGNGKTTAGLADLVPAGWVVGLDYSGEMTQFASENHRRHNLLFVKGNLTNHPFVEQFDLVTANCALIWISDQKAAFESIRQSLVSGGLFLAVQPAANPANLSPVAERIAATPRWSPHFPDFQPQRFYLAKEECIDLLTQVALEPLLVEATYPREHYPSMDAFLDWLRPIAGFANHLPDNLREEFLREIAAEMVTIDPQGVWLPDNKLEVIARRPLESQHSGQ